MRYAKIELMLIGPYNVFSTDQIERTKKILEGKGVAFEIVIKEAQPGGGWGPHIQPLYFEIADSDFDSVKDDLKVGGPKSDGSFELGEDE